MKYLFSILFLLIYPISESSWATAGVYDGEIAAIEKYFGEYNEQNKKNIEALIKMSGAYRRLNNVAADIIRGKKMLQGSCVKNNLTLFKTCLANQSTAISMLDMYTRHTEKVARECHDDAVEAGRILGGNDVNQDLARIDSFGKDFKNWREQTIPALKAMFEKERELYVKRSGQEFEKDFREQLFLNSDKTEASFLGVEIDHTGERLAKRGEFFLKQHRLGHARLTLESIKWLKSKVPTMWKALSEDAAAHPKIQLMRKVVDESLQKQADYLQNEILKRNPATELKLGFKLLKETIDRTNLDERNKKAYVEFFNGYQTLEALKTSEAPNKIAAEEVLLERGWAWLEAVNK